MFAAISPAAAAADLRRYDAFVEEDADTILSHFRDYFIFAAASLIAARCFRCCAPCYALMLAIIIDTPLAITRHRHAPLLLP